jgi:lysozyme family protein/peptidoglycan hydrolase-like protein with peptidoglycan-binding domain
MLSFEDLKDGYERNWAHLQIRPSRLEEARREASRLLQGKATYQQIEARSGAKWYFLGLCHYRESHFDFDTYLGNGQSLGRVTTIVPKGRGPFTGPNAFADGAIDALRIDHLLGATDWSIARILFRLEGFNGFGYHGKGVNSPYLYGGSNLYGPPEARGGKFVRDHVFDANVVDTQLGTAVILKALLDLDPTIDLEEDAPAGQAAAVALREPDDELADTVLLVQQQLNQLGADPRLVEDGRNGPRTKAAISRFQQDNDLADTGLPDAATIAALAQKSRAPTADAMLPVLQRIKALENTILSVQATPNAPKLPDDPVGIIERLLAIVQKSDPASPTAPVARDAVNVDQLKRLMEIVTTLMGKDAAPPLGQVNGALGDTIGNLLNGKKAALGIGGALITSLLSAVTATPGSGGLAGLLGTVVTAVPGLSQFAMPVFLALSAWGALGKLEKWAQGTAPPPHRPA